MRMSRCGLGRAAWLMVAALAAVPVAAQPAQDGGLIGVVADVSGAALAGVTVMISSSQLIGGPQTTVSDASGRYRFPALPPGIYALEASLDGFKSTRHSAIVIPPGFTMSVDVVLAPASVAETVVVNAIPPVVDVRTSASTTVIERALLENLPLGRNVSGASTNSYINLSPGVTRNVGFGGSQAANQVALDGASGNEPGWGTPVTPFSRTWIDEIQVAGPGASAQHGGFTGALLNAITRSGANRFSGLGEYWTTRHRWTDDNRGDLTASLAAQFRPLEVLTRWEGLGQTGGPIVGDRAWFFVGLQRYRDDVRSAAFSVLPRTPDEPPSSVTEQRGIGKLTSALSNAIRLEGFYSRNALKGRGVNAGPLVEPEAMMSHDNRDDIWNARVTWTLGSNTLLEARHGGNDRDGNFGAPPERRHGPAPHFDLVTNVQSVNAIVFQDWASRIVTTSSALTRYVDGFAGVSHDLKTGFEYERASLLDARGQPGGMLFYDRDGQPYQVRMWDGATYRGRHSRTTMYAQDAWTVASPLTLNLGVRADWYHASPPYPARYRTHSVAPRIGLAWDVGSRHDTAVRAHYGRYHDPIVTSYYDFLDPLASAPDITAEVVGPGEFRELFRFLPATGFAIDPNIKSSYVEEFLAAVERSMFAGFSLKTQYVHRRFEDTASFIDTATIWEPIELPDPGPDGRRGTADDAGLITVYNVVNPGVASLVLTNPPQAYRRYHAVQLIGTRRYAAGWALQSSYTWSRTRGNFDNAFSSNAANNDNSINGVFVNPNRAINNEGPTSFDFTHSFKTLGTMRVPWWHGWTVSGIYRYETGPRWGRIVTFTSGLTQGFAFVRAEPRHRRAPATHVLDLRLEKTVRLGMGNAGLYADIFNLLNDGRAVGLVQQSGPRFGMPARWSDPRILRVGARLQF